MKTKITLVFLSIFIVFLGKAQPKKGTWGIGGSGYRFKISQEKELQYKVYEINAEANYFLFKHLALGGNVTFKGSKDYTLANNDRFYGFYIAPSIEAYILNRKMFGLSVKGKINIVASTSWTFNEGVYSYLFGPKLSWNITPNLNTYLWVAYRRLDEYTNMTCTKNTIPSDNFDIRWGFSYFLHRKEKE